MDIAPVHPTAATLAEGQAHIAASPRDRGTVELIACRPARGERLVVEVARLDEVEGLVGDCWRTRGAHDTPDGRAHPLRQITLMNQRVAALVAGGPDHGGLPGDQLYVDLDLGVDNLPPGTRLVVGEAVLEVTEAPHRGCATFAERFGRDALRFVNVGPGRAGNYRGLNAVVRAGGTVRRGDPIIPERPGTGPSVRPT
jgi:hypothetical protein